MKRNKKHFVRSTSLLLAVLLMLSPIFPFVNFGTTAQALTYRTGANGPAATYKASKYYTHATSINLTGDGVTDTLSLALSQLGYYEGTSSNQYGGLYNTHPDSGSYASNGTTEYVYNYGDADSSGYKMAWCASFCSWAIFQAGVTNHSTHAQSCRNHTGDRNYIWRECSCYQWADQLKRFDMYYARGSYTPKAGDLIFFKMDGGGNAWTNHIGLVLYSDGSRVYTVEGNRKNHVGLYNYSLSDSQICGYGVLPYPSKADAPKVDYTGKNKTAGQYITNNATLSVSSTKGGSAAFTVGKYEMFEVTGFDGSYAKVSYGGQTGYATLSSTTIQVTATVKNNMNAYVATTDGKTSVYMGGKNLPDSNKNFENPNVLVEGLSGNTNNYKGLENYGTNKDKIIINGRTLSKWEEHPDAPIINNVWVYSAGDGSAYVGIDIADNSVLRVKDRDGTGEEIESIVIKRGFEIVSTTSDLWTGGEITTNGTGVGDVVGVLKENVILTAIDNIYYNVTLGGSDSLELDGYTFETKAPQFVKMTAGANVRVGPGGEESYSALAFADAGDVFEYLGEVRNSKWLMVDCNGQLGWINSDYASVIDAPQVVEITGGTNIRVSPDASSTAVVFGNVGDTFAYLEETCDSTNPANSTWFMVYCNGQVAWVNSAYASVVDAAQHVTLTADANIRSGPDTSYSILGVGTASSSFEYLGEIQNTKWLKVNYNGQTGWISNANATLSKPYGVVQVTAENRGWTESTITEVNLSTANSAQIRTQGAQGLRFVSTIDKKSADFDRVVKFGTVLIPSEDITDISQLVLGETLNGHDVLDVPAKYIFSETEDEITFTVVLKNIAESNLNREYTARAYAILDDGSVIYADSGVSRSVYRVAQKGLEDPEVSDADKTVFQEIINKVEGLGE